MNTRPVLSKSISSLLFLGAAFTAAHPARATSDTWDGSTSALWSLDTNWLTNPGVVPGTGDTATFSATSAAVNGFTTIDLTGGITIGSILFDTASAAAYTIGTGTAGSQALILDDAGSISMSASVANNQLVNAALTLGTTGTTRNFTLSNASTTNTLTVAGGITGFAGAGFRTLAVTGAGNTTLSGIIGNGTTGVVALTKSGTGTLTLSGANTFTGGLRINAGTVVATTNVLALGTGTGPVVVGAGANLNFGTANLTYGTNIGGAGTINANTLGTGTNSLGFTGNLSGFTGTLNVGTGGGRVRFQSTGGNQISSSATINVLNGSTLLVDNLLTYGASLFLNGGGSGESLGNLRIESGAVWTGAVTFNTTTTIGTNLTVGTIASNISDGGGAFGFSKVGAQTLMLTGANAYTGSTTVSTGTLQLGNGGTTGTLATGSAIISNATFAINRSNAVTQGTDFSGAAISGTGGFSQAGTGTTTLTAANTYTGTTTVSRGILNIGNGITGSLATSAVTLNGNGLINFNEAAGSTQALGALTFNAGYGTLQSTYGGSGSNTLTFSSLARTAGATGNFLVTGGAPTSNQIILIGVTPDTLVNPGTFFGDSSYAWYDAAAYVRGIVYGVDPGAVTTGASGSGLTAATHAQMTGAVTGQNTATFTTLNISGNNSLTLNAAQAVTVNGILKTGNTVGGATISGGSILPFGLTADLVVRTDGANDAVTITSTITPTDPAVRTGTTAAATAIVTGLSSTADLAPGMQVIVAGGVTATILSVNSASQITLSANSGFAGTPNLTFTNVNGLTKSGNGALTLASANTYGGRTFLNGGTLNIGNIAALGTVLSSGLTIYGGTLDNSSGAALTTTGAKAQAWNGDFTFTGSNDLNFGTGIATVGGPLGARTVTFAGGTMSVDRVVAPAGYTFTKAGAGTLRVTNAGNETTNLAGIVNLSAGKIQTSADITFGGITGSGTIENGLGGNANKWFRAGSNGVDTTFSGTIQNGTSPLGFVKQGGGTTTLSGTNTPSDLRVDAGTLRITGTTTASTGGAFIVVVGTTGNQNGVLLVDGGTLNATKNTNPSIQIAPVANGVGFLKLTSGTINSTSEIRIGNGNGAATTNAYAALSVSGGTLNSGNWFVVAHSNDRAVFNQTGGAVTVTTNRMTIGAGNANSIGVVSQSAGTFSAAPGIFLGENGSGTINLSGTAVMTLGPTGTLQFGNNATSTFGSFNLLGGSFSANSITKGASSGAAVYNFNFNGGTLLPTVSNANFFNDLANTSAYVYSGGAKIDTNGFDITVNETLLDPTGTGVNSVASFTGGSGYIDTPVVTVFGDGVGATAVANVAGGVVTGITITNPGIGYTTAPTFTVFGGGASVPATITGAAPTANVGGGLTKSGAGTLILPTNNTYTGPTVVTGGTLNLTGVNASTAATTVTGGTLLLSGAGEINTSSGISINGLGAKFVQSSSTAVAPVVTLTSGTLDGTSTINSVTVVSSATSILTNGNGSTGALTIDNLTFNDAATLSLNLATPSPTILPVLLTTNLITGAINGAGKITINANSPLWNEGNNNLISYTTLGGLGFSEFLKGTITGLSGRQSATLTNPAGFIALNVVGDNPVWTGLVSGAWTTSAISGSKNWKLITAATPTDFLTNDIVLFDDTAAGTTALDITTANVNPLSTIFNNTTALPYTLTSTGGFGIATGTLTKNSDGVVTISNANTYAGGTTVNGGTLNINNASAIGTGALILNAGATIDSTGGGVTLTTNNVQTWNADVVFGGTNNLNLGTGAVALSASRTVTTNGAATLTVGGVISGAGLSLTKDGPGVLTLGGASTYTGATTVNGGTLTLTGTINAGNVANLGQITVSNTAADAVLRVAGGTLNATKTAAPSIGVALSAGSSGAVFVDAGTVTATSELMLANAAGAYGAFTINGGAVSFGNWISAGRAGNGILTVNGGSLAVTTQNLTSGSFAGSAGVINLTGGVTNITSVAANQGELIVAEGGSGILTVSGAAAVNISGARGMRIGANGGPGIANLNGGIVTTPIVQRGTGTATLNFGGGTLRASANAPTFLTGLTDAYIYSGGAVIDTNSFAVTVAQPLLAPTGDGVTAAGLSIGGTGFISAPLVQISGGGGAGATAVANVDSLGNLTGITITNPGQFYSSDPTFTLVGGGLGNTGSITGSAVLTPNVGGGLTKTGTGTLTLAGSSTYSGATVVNAGTLVLSDPGDINGSSGISINGPGAKLVQNSLTNVVPTVTVNNGTLDGTTAYDAVLVPSGSGNIVANGNGGTGALAITALTFNNVATLNLRTASTAAVLNTTSLTTGAVNAAGLITINATNASWANGSVYNLISYTGAIGGAGFGEFTLGTVTGLTNRQTPTLTNPAGFVALSIAGDLPVWTGLSSGAWTLGAVPPNKNWKLLAGGTQTDFLNLDTVLFDDSAAGTTTVSITDANVNPTSTTFNNTTKTYTVSSGGGFGIASGFLTMTGGGLVTIGTNNTYTGGTFISNGTLNMTGNNNFGTGGVTSTGGTATFSGANTYTGGTTANGGALTLSGNNTFGAGVVTVNTGTLTLAGVNTYTGATTVNGGTLNVNNGGALGTAALTVNGGALGNTSGLDVVFTAAKAQTWNGDFAYSGPNSVDFVGNATVAGPAGTRTVNVTAGTLGAGYIFAPVGFGLTKTGAGNLAMTANANNLAVNTINGVLDIQGGRVQTSSDLRVGGLTGSGTVELGFNADKWLFLNDASDATFSGTIQDNPNNAAGHLGLIKEGLGNLDLTGANNTPRARLDIQRGKIRITGTYVQGYDADANRYTRVGSLANQNGVLQIDGGNFSALGTNGNGGGQSLSIAVAASSQGFLKLTSGSITTAAQLLIGAGAGAVNTEPFAAFSMSGGTLTTGSWLVVGGNNDRAVFNQSGGAVVVSTNRMTIGAGGANSIGVANLSGGTFTDNAGIFVGENGTGTLNVSGSSAVSLGAAGTLQFGGNATSLAGTVNLLGGTVSTSAVTKGAGSGIYRLNFNGGILKATATNPAFLADLANTSAYVYAGGGTIDDGGFDITIAEALLAPTGGGVSASGVTVSGSGFLDTPLVQVSGDGTGATAVATIDGSGNLTGITVTNPGINYTNATFTLLGGGVGSSGSVDTGPSIVANTSGTLTKAGAGTTTLTGLQQYSTLTTTDGLTVVNTSLTGGTQTVNATGGSDIDFGASQTISSLNIGAGSVVTLLASPGFAPFADPDFGGKGAASSAVVPEPGTVGLLLVGALGVLSRRRRKA